MKLFAFSLTVINKFYIKIAVFWVVAPCSLIEVVEGKLLPDYTVFWVVAPCSLVEVVEGKLLPDYTVLQPRRQQSSYSLP
jgi:hypothetical protein